MTHKVVWLERAEGDLDDIYRWLADAADPEIALRYTRQIKDLAARLADFPHRGSPRDDVADGLRSIPFVGGATIFYSANSREVLIERVIRARRDLRSAFEDSP